MKGSTLDSGRLVQGIILLGFTTYMIKLLATGEINNLLSPLAANLLIVTGGVMLVMTIYCFTTMFKKEHAHAHHHHEHAAAHDHGHDHHEGCNHDHGHEHHEGCDHDHGHEHHAGCNHDHGHDHHDHSDCGHDHDHDHNPKPRLAWAFVAAPMVLGLLFPTQSLGVSMVNNSLTVSPTQSVELTNTVEAEPAPAQNGTGTTTDANKQPNTKTQTGTTTGTTSGTTGTTGTTSGTKEPVKPLGSTAASSYAVDMTKVPRAKGGHPGDQPKAGEEVQFSDIMMDIAIKPDWYYNNRFKFKGFVYRPEGWPMEKMILMRFMITHCSADASPIGMLIDTPDAAKYKNDTWLEVNATVSLKEMPELDNVAPAAWFKGYPYKPVLIGHTIQEIDQPKYPYLLSRALRK